MNGSEIQLPIGTQVGRYIVLERLGKGGMGVVYKAFDPQLDRAIALKVVDLVGLQKDRAPRRRARLLREAQALAKLSHPNIVAVHDVGTFGENVFIAMELVEGDALNAWALSKRPSVSAIRKIMLEAGRGLWAAHQAGIIHRDFKPQNVIIGHDGRLRVLDFGLACAVERAEEPTGKARDGPAADDLAQSGEPSLDSVRVDLKLPDPSAVPFSLQEQETLLFEPEAKETPALGPADPAASPTSSSGGKYLYTPLTQCGARIGTPAYMSPEQHLSDPTDPRSDQFSFCVVFYELLYGQLPFPAAGERELAFEVITGKILPPPEDAKVPRWLAEIVRRGLSTRPEDRFESMGTLLEALSRDPTRSGQPRRLLVAMSALWVVALASPLGVWYGMHRHSSLCKGAEGRLGGVWDPPARQAIQSAFLASGKVYAPDVFARVSQGLTQRFAEWTQAYTEVCEATRIRGEQSERLMDLKMRCLGQQLDQASALVRLFKKPDDQVLKKAIQLSAGLPRAGECADTDALGKSLEDHGAPLPPSKKQEVDKLQGRLGEIRILVRAGKYQEGLALAVAAADRAMALGFLPLRAEVAFVLGDIQVNLGDYPKAESLLDEAWVLAESSGMDGLKAQAISYLVFLAGYHQARVEHALWLSTKAAAAIQRTPNNERLWARFHSCVGTVFSLKGEYERAEQELNEARDLLEKIHGPENLEVATALNNLGNVLYQRKQVDRSLQCFQRALAIKEKILGRENPEIALPLTNIGQILHAQGHCQESLAHLQRALQIMETSLGPAHRFVGNASIHLGDTRSCLGQVESARASYRRGLEILEKSVGPAHPELAEAYARLGRFELGEGAYQGAALLLKRAIGICQAVPCEPQIRAEAEEDLGKAGQAYRGQREPPRSR